MLFAVAYGPPSGHANCISMKNANSTDVLLDC